MFHRILVALDESDRREQVVDAAIALATAQDAQLRLVHVVTFTENDLPRYPLALTNVGFVVEESVYEEVLQRYVQEQQEFEKRHLNVLQDTAQAVAKKGVLVDYCLAYGDPGKEICDMAQSWHADTIVLGRRGNVGLKEFLLGSVSNHVVHHAPCTVLVVQGETTGLTECN